MRRPFIPRNDIGEEVVHKVHEEEHINFAYGEDKSPDRMPFQTWRWYSDGSRQKADWQKVKRGETDPKAVRFPAIPDQFAHPNQAA